MGGGTSPQQGGQTRDNRQEQGEREPGQERPESAGEEPRGNREDPDESDTRKASKSPDQETQDPLTVHGGREQWGNLPIHLRELFRAEGGQRLPARYRDWIDTYYRRLNRRSGD